MKMSWSRFIAVTIAAAGLAFSASAFAAPVAGDHEAEVSAGFFHAQGSDSGSFNADISLGHYLTPGWELGFRQALSYNFIDGARDEWVATTTPFLRYNFHFLDGRLVPCQSTRARMVPPVGHVRPQDWGRGRDRRRPIYDGGQNWGAGPTLCDTRA